MAYKENIWSGKTDLALAEAYPLERPWEAGVVLDQNESHKEDNEDVVVIAENNGALFLQVLDGISASQRQESPQLGYESRVVALYFAEQSLAQIKPVLESQSAIDLKRLHERSASAVRHSYTNGDSPLGGLVGVSALLLPDGRTQINRFGDTEGFLDKQGGLEIPKELYPENLGLREYLKWCHDQGCEPDIERDTEWRTRLLNPRREDRIVSNQLSNNQADTRLTIGPDFKATLSPGEGVFLATDGLKILKNFDTLRGYDWRNKPVEALMHDVHMRAISKTASADNLSGAYIRMLK